MHVEQPKEYEMGSYGLEALNDSVKSPSELSM